MNNLKNLLVTLITLIAALGVIGGAVYAYQKASSSRHEADSVINTAQNNLQNQTNKRNLELSLAETQGALKLAIRRLDEMYASFSPGSAISDTYASFASTTAALRKESKNIHGPATIQINTINNELSTTLQAWKNLINSFPSSGPTQDQINQSQQYAQQIEAYLDQLRTIADTLTPDNSGLTQDQINTYQDNTDKAAQGAGDSNHDLSIALIPPNDTGDSGSPSDTGNPSSSSNPDNSNSNPDTNPANSSNPSNSDTTNNGSGTSGGNGPITAGDIADQQQTVTDLQNQVDQIQHDISDASSTPDQGSSGPSQQSGTLDDSQPPQIQYDIYGRPKLIQGSNKQ